MSTDCIYIPLCFYLYPNADPTSLATPTNLHSTMFLLIRQGWSPDGTYSSIYIPLCFYLYRFSVSTERYHTHLHSTMFLLIPLSRIVVPDMDRHLHSTMFLLIPPSGDRCLQFQDSFTFHYVSTYTCRSGFSFPRQFPFTFHYVSTYTEKCVVVFSTSVKIYIPLCFYLYSYWAGLGIDENTNLHSTMFLLIR